MKTELVSQAQVGEICAKYHNAGFRLQTMIATDERATQSTYVLRYVFFHDEQQVRVTVESRLAASDPSYASATPMVPAAEWYEREALDLLGLIPLGHPQPDPLVLHGDRLSGLYPLRKDFPLEGPLPQVVRTLEQEPLSDGAFEVPVGPIHAGIIEPGHFRFQVRGEVVEALKATLFYTHRGLEKKAEGLSLAEGLALAEQACGVCSVSHGLSYAQAVESLAHMQVPEQARYTRVVWLKWNACIITLATSAISVQALAFPLAQCNAGASKKSYSGYKPVSWATATCVVACVSVV